MREINLDATTWVTGLDFYAALLPALGAPAWHSSSAQAIADSMIAGEINAVEPPYVVRIHNLARQPDDVVEEVECAEGAIARERADWLARHGGRVEVCLDIVR